MNPAIGILSGLTALMCLIRLTNAQGALMSSVKNGHTAKMAMDSNVTSCAMSGIETAPWWMVDLGRSVAIRGVLLIGDLPAVNIRVGDHSTLIGNRGGFDKNGLCKLVLGINLPNPVNITCTMAAQGRYLSIQSVDNTFLGSILLCDVTTY